MAIQKQIIINKGRRYIRRYSDEGYMLERDGMRYAEAVDPAEYEEERSYTETDERIEGWTDEATIEDYQEALARLGVE